MPEYIEEKNYFFRLSAYQDRLLGSTTSGRLRAPEFRYNEARASSPAACRTSHQPRGRDLGIPLPWDESQVAYVWADALVNYLSALTYARPGEDLVPRSGRRCGT